MRLISQKGLLRYTDVEYESGTITINDLSSNGANVIYAWDGSSNEAALMAKYSSKEKAEKVLEDMTKLYGSYVSCKGGHGILQGSGYQPAFCFTPPKVFRFPVDDEMGV